MKDSSIRNVTTDPPANTNAHETVSIKNIFRDTPIRYLGYANEIGESFRYQYPKCVVPSYVVAFGYCLADALSTGYHTYFHYSNVHPNNNNYNNTSYNNTTNGSTISNSNDAIETNQVRLRRTIVNTLDTLLWQTFASVLIPGYVIHTIVKVTKYSMPKQVKVPLLISTWLPTVMGLGAIPFIVHPIDHSVDYVLDNTVRSFYRHYL
jgi:fission process protein 1